MGADSSKEAPVFRKMTPDEKRKQDKLRRNAAAEAAKRTRLPAAKNTIQVTSRELPQSSSMSDNEDACSLMHDGPVNGRRNVTTLHLEPLPPIQSQIAQQSNDHITTRTKRHKTRPPPVKHSQLQPIRKDGPVLERNVTLLSVASVSESLSEVQSPRGFYHQPLRNVAHRNGLTIHNVDAHTQQDSLGKRQSPLTPTDSYLQHTRPDGRKPGDAVLSGSNSFQKRVNVTRHKQETDQPVMERNLTLISVSEM